MNKKKFIHPDAMGNSWGVVSTEQQWGNVYGLYYNKPEQRIESAVWQNLFLQALAATTEFGAVTVHCRVRKDYDVTVFANILTALGFKKKSERIEYKSEISKLPREVGTPLVWKTARELQWSESQLAEFLGKIEPDEKPEEFIQDFLHHDELTHGLDCIAIGFIEEQACALVVAQVDQKIGWSRLSYMGLIPEYRKKGLGSWVHRHGFEMMKSQGGKLYHGGTSSQNIPMRKLFENHGCTFFCEMEEWQR